jgi:hypothetical protein
MIKNADVKPPCGARFLLTSTPHACQLHQLELDISPDTAMNDLQELYSAVLHE